MKVIRPSCREKPRAADDKEPGSGCTAPPTFFCFFCNGFSLVCFYDHCFSHSVLQWLFFWSFFHPRLRFFSIRLYFVLLTTVNSLKRRVSSSNSNWRVKTILFWPREAGAISETCRLHLSSVWPPSYKTVLIHMEITFQIIRSLVEESSIFFFNWGIRNCLTVVRLSAASVDSRLVSIWTSQVFLLFFWLVSFWASQVFSFPLISIWASRVISIWRLVISTVLPESLPAPWRD